MDNLYQRYFPGNMMREIHRDRFNIDSEHELVKIRKVMSNKVQTSIASESKINNNLKTNSITNVIESPYRKKFIDFLAHNIFDVIMLNKEIKDNDLRAYFFKRGMGENLYFLTQSYYRQNKLKCNKHNMSDFITEEAREILLSKDTNNSLIFEHMVPKNIYLKKISDAAMNGSLTEKLINELFDQFLFVCTVAKKNENERLPANSMGMDWDHRDPFFRYKAVGIPFYPNIYNQLYFPSKI
ncbi:hypothetical protein JOC27_001912 [Sporolactobacillus spathodeae]|uniref:Uncharacterized protein n=1 Tax=Sporolactobacillus spathodeae TaxID=1465502 RepID=A0ABS2Q9K0_9BACL|nr:hypothetical protein [Sporolactobacillus spathodeae]